MRSLAGGRSRAERRDCPQQLRHVARGELRRPLRAAPQGRLQQARRRPEAQRREGPEDAREVPRGEGADAARGGAGQAVQRGRVRVGAEGGEAPQQRRDLPRRKVLRQYGGVFGEPACEVGGGGAGGRRGRAVAGELGDAVEGGGDVDVVEGGGVALAEGEEAVDVAELRELDVELDVARLVTLAGVVGVPGLLAAAVGIVGKMAICSAEPGKTLSARWKQRVEGIC